LPCKISALKVKKKRNNKNKDIYVSSFAGFISSSLFKFFKLRFYNISKKFSTQPKNLERTQKIFLKCFLRWLLRFNKQTDKYENKSFIFFSKSCFFKFF